MFSYIILTQEKNFYKEQYKNTGYDMDKVLDKEKSAECMRKRRND